MNNGVVFGKELEICVIKNLINYKIIENKNNFF